MVIRVSGQVVKDKNTVEPGQVVVRPSGPGYVRYEDLYVAGDSFQTVVHKVTGNNVLTLPAGTFTWSDFTDPIGYHDGIRIPVTCGGIAGSGIGVTILTMVANSSTVAAYDPSTGTNPIYMMYVDNVENMLFQDFTMIGQEQGHHYNGFGIHNGSGSTFQRIRMVGVCRGFANYPPGECFGLNIYNSNNVRLIDVEVDGRDNTTGARVGTSGIGWNFANNAFMQRCYIHHGLAGMLTFWQVVGLTTIDVHTYSQGTGTGSLSSNGINHENVTGTVRHTRPNLILAGQWSGAASLTTDNGQHMTFNNSFAPMTDCQVFDPVYDVNANSQGCFAVAINDGYPTQQNGFSLANMPQIIFGGVVAAEVDANTHGSLAGVTATNSWFRYH